MAAPTRPQRDRAKWRSDLSQEWGRGAAFWKCQKSCHHREQQVLRRIAFAALKDEEEEGTVGRGMERQRRNDAEEQVRETASARRRKDGWRLRREVGRRDAEDDAEEHWPPPPVETEEKEGGGGRSSSRCGYGCGSSRLLAQARDSFMGVARCAENPGAVLARVLWPAEEAAARASRSLTTSVAPHFDPRFETADEAAAGYWRFGENCATATPSRRK